MTPSKAGSGVAGGGHPGAGGFLLLDKPTGVSSFQALHPLKRIFRGLKVGHAGTLDPAASGLLVLALLLPSMLLCGYAFVRAAQMNAPWEAAGLNLIDDVIDPLDVRHRDRTGIGQLAAVQRQDV